MQKIKKNTDNSNVNNLILVALLLTLGLILPFLTGQIPQIGSMLLPMHIPVLLCGLICGWKYGVCVGFVTPIFRSLLFGMPIMYPMALSMAVELAMYGFVIGILYTNARWQCIKMLYKCLIVAMISGRVAWGIMQSILLGVGANGFGLKAFVAGALTGAVPGIILQLVLIPCIMLALNRTGLVPFRQDKSKHCHTVNV